MILLNDKEKIIKALESQSSLDIKKAAKILLKNEKETTELLRSMEFEGIITVKRLSDETILLTKEGTSYLNGDFPEEVLLKKIMTSPISITDVKDSIALGWARRNEWIELKENKLVATKKGMNYNPDDYPIRIVLKDISKNQNVQDIQKDSKELLKTLKSRKLIELVESKRIESITLNVNKEQNSGVGQLTRGMIKSGEWRNVSFKRYDVNAEYEKINSASIHPMHAFLNDIANIWVSMGFTEVKGPIIEPAFWNFDTLFIPQDHPTRDTQDTFFLSNPSVLNISDMELLAKTKKAHKQWWKYEMDDTISSMGVLRTHTTSVSSHQMRSIGKAKNVQYPVKLFSIGKVFRNESVDYKHLAEFYQLEGLVVGDGLNLAHLLGIIKDFWGRLGIDIKIRPSSFAFVEPGLEAYFYSKQHQTNIELCGGGIIRREITESMGIKKPVLAWGMGLDRVVLDKYKLDSITEIYKNKLSWLHSSHHI